MVHTSNEVPPPSDRYYRRGTRPKKILWLTALGSLLLAGLVGVAVYAGYLPLALSREASAPAAATATPSPVPAAASPEADITVVGDMFFDRYIRQISDERGQDYIFSCLGGSLSRSDFMVGNLEGPITATSSVSEGTKMGTPKNYIFTFPTSTAALLARHAVRIVNIGNNHIGNMGMAGIAETRAYLSAAGVGSFGGLAGDEPIYRIEDKGVPLSFVNYNQFGGNTPAEVAQTIAEEHVAGRTVIVYAHWGTEYSEDVSRIRPIALLFAQSGAAAVIVSHPHIVLSHEYIGTTLVYYSLGNFIFDQYWNEQVDHGLALLLHIEKGRVTAEEFPVVLLSDGRTCPA